MDMFGLGLVLEFKDHASSAMKKAQQAMEGLAGSADDLGNQIDANLMNAQALTHIGLNMGFLGQSMVSSGSKIIGKMKDVGMSVVNTGDQFEKYQLALNNLFHGEEEGMAVMNKLQKLATQTPFEVADLVEAELALKASGLDALTVYKTASMQEGQTLAQYVADIKALKPHLEMTDITRGIRNALGGNTKSIENIMDVKVDANFTEGDVGQNLADLVDKMGGAGLAESMGDTWSMMISNIEDQFTRLKLAIGDSGVFESLKQALKNVYKAIDALSDEDMATIGKSIAGAFTIIINPIKKVSEWLAKIIKQIPEFAEKNPLLFKMASAIAGISGAFLVAGGTALKFSGKLFTLVGTFLMFKNGMDNNGDKILTFGKILNWLYKGIIPLITIGGLLYYAWSTDFMGIKSNGRNMVESLLEGLKLVADAFLDNTLSTEAFKKAEEMGILPLIEAILDLKYRFGFFVDGFVEGCKKVAKTTLTILGGALSMITGMDLSTPDKFLNWLRNLDPEKVKKFGEHVGKMVANFLVFKTFVDPFIGAINKVSKLLSKGFNLATGIAGFLFRMATYPFVRILKLKNAVGGLWDTLKKAPVIGNPLTSLVASAKVAVSSYTIPLKSALRNLGTDLKEWSSKSFSKIGNSLKTHVGDVGRSLVSHVGDLKPKLQTALSKLFDNIEIKGNGLQKALTKAMSGLGAGKTKISGLGESLKNAIVGVGPKLSGYVGKLKPALSSAFTALGNTRLGGMAVSLGSSLSSALSGLGSAILPALSGLGSTIMAGLSSIPVIGWVIGGIGLLSILIYNFGDDILGFFSGIGDSIMEFLDPAITWIKEKFTELWNNIQSNPVVQFITGLIGIIATSLAPTVGMIVGTVVGGLKFIWHMLSGLGGVISSVFSLAGTLIGAVISTVVSIVQNAWKVISSVVNLGYQIVRTIFLAILAVGKIVFMTIGAVINGVWNGVIKPVITLFQTAWNVACSVVSTVVNGLVSFFSTAWNFLKTNVITPVANFFSTIWTTVCNVVSGVINGLVNFFSTTWTWLQNNVINPVAQFFSTVWTIASGIVNGIINGIANFFSTTFTWVQNNVLTPLGNFFGTIFGTIGSTADTIIGTVKGLFDDAYGFVTGIWDGITGFFDGLWSGIKDGVDKFINWFKKNFSWVTNAIDAVGDFLSNPLDFVAKGMENIGDSIANFIGLDTGGYVKSEGLAVLHPNEVVVNAGMTKALGGFLDTFGKNNGMPIGEMSTVPTGSATPVQPAEIVSSNVSNDFSSVDNSTRSSVTSNHMITRNNSKVSEDNSDNSVTFEQGSIQFIVQNAKDITQNEMKKWVDYLSNEIDRKKKLKGFAVRNPLKGGAV